MQPPLLTRLLLLLIQFTLLALALDSKPSSPLTTLADTAAEMVDCVLDPGTDTGPAVDTSPQADTSPAAEAEAERKEVVGKGGGGETEMRKRPPMLRRSSSWASSRERVQFVGVLGSGRWLGGG